MEEFDLNSKSSAEQYANKEGENNTIEEIPEIFGSSQERKERAARVNEEIEKQIQQLNISPEDLKIRIDQATRFIINTNLYHRTSFESVRSILKDKSNIVSLRELEDKGKKIKPFPTYNFERRNNLDKFVFLAMDTEPCISGDTIIEVQASVLKDRPTIVTGEDLLHIMSYEGYNEWEIDLLERDEATKKLVLSQYKNQSVDGEDFLNILSKILAMSYKESPEEHYPDEKLRSNMKEKIRKLFGIANHGYSINPEIRVLNYVPFEKIKGVQIADPQQKSILIQMGVPPENISFIK